jgi:hypothetical protein
MTMQQIGALNLPSRCSTSDVTNSYHILVQVSFKFFCCTLSHFKPMHKDLMCFGFHHIGVFRFRTQMKHQDLFFGFGCCICYILISIVIFECFMFCCVHHSICIVNGCVSLLFQFLSLMVVFQWFFNFHCQCVLYCFDLLVHHKIIS